MRGVPKPLVPVVNDARIKQFPKGQIIFYESDVAPEIYIIKEGVVKIYDIDENGNEKILHIVNTHGVIPLVFFSGTKEGTQWFYTAVTDCEVYVVPREKLNEAMTSNSSLAVYLMNWFSREVHELLVRVSSMGKTNTRDKLVAVLKFLCVHHSHQRLRGWRRVTFPISHQFLADMVGVTRESAAMVMKEMQDEKLIRNPKLTVLEINFDKLVRQSSS